MFRGRIGEKTAFDKELTSYDSHCRCTAHDSSRILCYSSLTTSPAVSTLGAGALRSPLFICAVS